MFNPFDLNHHDDYQRWRERKLKHAARHLSDLVVQVDDPRFLRLNEYRALLECIQKNNMVIYAGKNLAEDKSIPRMLGEQFGLMRLNHNWLADEDAITSLAVNSEGEHPNYIPYTNRAINWHTDGYYNRADEQICGLLLHCVRAAQTGGENRLMDHEIAYIRLRDANPEFIAAFMLPDAMTIPPRMDEQGVARAVESGPVFSVLPGGDLHMRYTARKRNVIWKDNAVLKQAVKFLEQLLDLEDPFIFRGRLEPGMGLISNNVLHDRAGFEDVDSSPRLLYRARYFDRIAHTSLHEMYSSVASK
jgi:alpha-ketoglutarate-dependent taurine dioxygenase